MNKGAEAFGGLQPGQGELVTSNCKRPGKRPKGKCVNKFEQFVPISLDA